MHELVKIDRANIHIYMHQMSEKYGPVYTLFMPMPSVIITQYDAIKEALVTKGRHERQRGPSRSTDLY